MALFSKKFDPARYMERSHKRLELIDQHWNSFVDAVSSEPPNQLKARSDFRAVQNYISGQVAEKIPEGHELASHRDEYVWIMTWCLRKMRDIFETGGENLEALNEEGEAHQRAQNEAVKKNVERLKKYGLSEEEIWKVIG